jgi:hypothetical protein
MNTKILRATATQGSARTDTAQRTMWNPLWLHRAWLGAYAMLFGSMFDTTLTLYIILVREKGLGTLDIMTGTVWFWKYCPTASMCITILLYQIR